jgi:small subunit ribosomal protein S20
MQVSMLEPLAPAVSIFTAVEGLFTLANTKSAIKHIRQSEKRRVQNRAVKSAARTYVKRARAAAESAPAEAMPHVVEAIRALDRAAQKGVIHRNNAARRKSRLLKVLRTHEEKA